MGGNVFKDKTAPIPKENIIPTVEKYFNELKKVFPKKEDIFNLDTFFFLGSALKKDISGDIDLGISLYSLVDKTFSKNSIEDWGLDKEKVLKQFQIYKNRARTATDEQLMTRALLKKIVEKINSNAENIYCDEKKVGSGGFFSLFPQYNKDSKKLNEGVQIDIIVSPNDELLKFTYYSDKYNNNVKSLHRTQLMVAMFSNVDITFSHTNGITDKETKNAIGTTPNELIRVLNDKYNFNITKEILKNYFTFQEYIKNNLDKEKYKKVMDTYFKILSHTRADIPENVQDLWKELHELNNYETKFLPNDSKLKSINT